MKFEPLNLLVHFANVLLLISYSVRSMLWLRWFAVASAVTALPYYLAQEEVLWPPVLWALVFIALNLYQIARIYAERRPVVLSADEQTLYDMGFQTLRPRQFLSFVVTGEWKDARPGDQVLAEGGRVPAVCIPIAGRIDVRRQGQSLMTMEPGHVIGPGLALTDTPSPVSAAFTETGRYIQWSLAQLRIFLERNPELRIALQRHVSQDLVRKLEAVLPVANGDDTGASS
jgi:Popeye protein conserved region